MVSILKIKTSIRLNSSFFGNDIHHSTYTTTSIKSRRSSFDYLYTLNSTHRHHIIASHIGITLPNRNFSINNYQSITITSRVNPSETYPRAQASSVLIYIINARHKAYGISYGRNRQFLDLCR